MSGVGDLDPFTNPDDWDFVTIQGVHIPGLAKVTGWARALNYDVKVGRGTAGATITLAGKPPAKGSITFRVWSRAQMLAWNAQVLPLLKFVSHPTGSATPTTTGVNGQDFTATQGGQTPAGTGFVNDASSSTTPAKGDTSGAYAAPTQPKALTKADALTIYHPALADIDVTEVLPPEELGQWEQPEVQLFERTIKFLEFTQAGGNIVATPNAAADTPAGDNYALGDTSSQSSPASPGNASGNASDAQGATVPKGFGGGKKG